MCKIPRNDEATIEKHLIDVLGQGHNQWNYREDLKSEEDLSKQTDLAASKLILGLKTLRKPCDEVEKVTDSSLWKLPTYKSLLFSL